jgi:pimeloyl-ACP methyl ester carboxylesterase
MLKFTAAVLAAMAFLAAPAVARIQPFPASFHTQTVETNGTSLNVRIGGQGPAVVLLHGFGDTGDMWAPLAALLAKDHTVIVPDLRGMGLSAHPDTGYTKKNQAVDGAGVMDALKIQKADLVTHDIGNMVGRVCDSDYASSPSAREQAAASSSFSRTLAAPTRHCGPRVSSRMRAALDRICSSVGLRRA